MKSITVRTLDIVFSKCIRERSDWYCEYKNCKYCKNYSFRDYSGGLHNSHFKGRRGRITRWDPTNCFALCHKRHEYMGDNPDEHAAWVRLELGDSVFDDLILRANGHRKYSRHDRWEMNVHYNAQLVKMEKQNKRKQGPLILTPWD